MANTERSRAQRLDQYVVQERPRISRGFANKLIDDGRVLVNGNAEKPGYKMRPTDTVTIDFDEKELDVIPAIELPILYEDDSVIVVNKPDGVISHARGKYWDEPSVASFVRQKVADIEGGERAGIVHRLDRATSGVMICAKSPDAMTFLQKQFSARSVKKSYTAIVSGHIKEKEAMIDMPIERNPKEPSKFRVGANGKASKTHYIVVEESPTHSLVQLTPETGRTHQLRVHLKQIGHPIVGDTFYDGEPAERLLLHAASLEITIPGGERKTFTAPLPKEFKDRMSQ
jgi:23S rRNA pseudouridine1911/1915/1917 synthase